MSYTEPESIIKESHLFQEKLSQSKLFPSYVAEVQRKQKKRLIGGYSGPLYMKDAYYANARAIVEDKGREHHTVDARTLNAISNEFYASNINNMDDLLGKENLESLNRIIDKNEFVDSMVLVKLYEKRNGCTYFEYKGYFDRGSQITGFVDELCNGYKPKEGDKVMRTINSVEDEQFGNINQVDFFLYEGGKHKHVYRHYEPLARGPRTVNGIVECTKAMQQKNKVPQRLNGRSAGM